jgi:ATP-dependent Clp protease adaptor protein ClpS
MDLANQLVPRKTSQPERVIVHDPLYRVIIHNDDVTPMDFVIHILITVFLIPELNSATIMYAAHLNGSAYVQTLPKSEARRRINKALFAARLRSLPLQFSLEVE